ncbi:30S ribosomal protein S18 [Candidatus Dojkabacteria bacterium]|nr:30S ribosomal protein S18 [Candidatus Dojkabacteria bacterium]
MAGQFNKRKRKKRREVAENLVCPFKNQEEITYKDVFKLKRFITTRGRIIPRSRSGVCSSCQRKLSREIKRARYMALLPFCSYS